FVAAMSTGQITLYDTETADPPLDFATHAWPNVKMVGFTRDGRRIVSGDPAGIYIWDARTGRLLRTLRDERHCQAGQCMRWLTGTRFLPQTHHGSAGSLDEAIFFDVETGQARELGVFIPEVKTVGFSRDGLQSYATRLDGTVLVWNMAEQSLVY